mmetsp:Transcript_21124/g.60569  ORF Transcript_21124/g.60569 Transcript_21124/m.60569 type:complete len:503 (+) Transcript_21124:97-1605(+)
MDRILPEAAHAPINAAIDFVYSYGPAAEKTVVLVPAFLTNYVESLAEATGFDSETINYTLGLFACYPLGIIMNMLPYGKIKHAFSFLLGAFLLQFTIGKQWVHQMITSLICYAMFVLLPPKLSKTIVPIFLMTYVTVGHLHRMYINYLGYDLDFTGPQMVITIKLYAMAYNLYDGHLISRGKEDRAAKKCAPWAIAKVPGIVEYLGYTFSFATILAGPAYEYKTYANACDGSLLYNSDGKPKGKIPSQIWPTLRAFLVSIITMGLFVVGTGKFPLLDPSDPQNATPVVLTAEFLARPWIQRYLYQWVALFFIRQKYYFAWKNAEGANNIWYAGFEGFDDQGNVKGWEAASNVRIVEFETAPNVKTLSAMWNMKTANWLSRYVYIRTGGSLTATYGLSAFWHGFYPGYYMFFLSVPILTFCERVGRKKLTPRFATSGSKWSPWGIVTMLSTSFVVEYMVAAFQLLSYDWAVANWKSHLFFGHILCFVFYGALSNLPSPKKKDV